MKRHVPCPIFACTDGRARTDRKKGLACDGVHLVPSGRSTVWSCWGTYGKCPSWRLDRLVRNLAAEFGPRVCGSMAICPGLVKTEFARELWDNSRSRKPQSRNEIPAAPSWRGRGFRGARPCSLLLMQARYMTGQALTVLVAGRHVDVRGSYGTKDKIIVITVPPAARPRRWRPLLLRKGPKKVVCVDLNKEGAQRFADEIGGVSNSVLNVGVEQEIADNESIR